MGDPSDGQSLSKLATSIYRVYALYEHNAFVLITLGLIICGQVSWYAFIDVGGARASFSICNPSHLLTNDVHCVIAAPFPPPLDGMEYAPPLYTDLADVTQRVPTECVLAGDLKLYASMFLPFSHLSSQSLS